MLCEQQKATRSPDFTRYFLPLQLSKFTDTFRISRSIQSPDALKSKPDSNIQIPNIRGVIQYLPRIAELTFSLLLPLFT